MFFRKFLFLIILPFSLFSQDTTLIHALQEAQRYHNHAKLYFWYATESHHQLKYYIKAEDLIKKSIDVIKEYESRDSQLLLDQNQTMLENINEIKGINKDNLNGVFPLFNEIMNITPHKIVVDEASELAIEASIEAVGSQLKGSKAIFDLTYFTIIESNYEDSDEKPGLVEVMRQAITEASTHYVVSNHELQKIIGKNSGYDGFSNNELSKIAQEFNTPQLGVIRIDLEDAIDGIYYNSCSFSLYDPSSDKKKQIGYSEAFRHDQKSNRDKKFIFIGIAFLVSLLIFFFKRNTPSWRQYFSLSLILSFIIVGILLAAIRLYPVSPSDFYKDPNSMIFWVLLGFSFSLIPIILTYIATMRFKFYPELIENVNKPTNLISIIYGACFGAICYLVTFQISEDGLTTLYWHYLLILILLFAPAYSGGKIASRYFLNRRTSELSGILINLFLILFCSLFLFLDLYQVNDIGSRVLFGVSTTTVFISSCLLVVAGSISSLYFENIAHYLKSKKLKQEIKINQDLFTDPPFVKPDSKLANRFDTILNDAVIFDTDLLKVNLIIGEKGSGKTRLIQEIINEKSESAVIFFGDCDKETSAINYEPFVEAFSPVLGKGVFMDQASQAKLLGGKIADSGILDAVPGGKILEQISAAGEEEVRDSAYIINEIVKELKNQEKNTIIIIDDTNNIDDDSLELLSNLIYEIGVNYSDFSNISFILSSNINLDDSDSNLEFLKELSANEIIQKEVLFENLSEDLKGFTSSLLRKLNMEYESERIIEDFITNEQKVDEPVNVITILRLIESYKLLDKSGKLSLVKNADLNSLPIDKHTTGIYTEKINTLDTELFNILECASYIGKTFEANVIVHIIGKDRLDILNRLREAEDMGLVIDKNDEDDIYEFTSRSLIKELRNHSIKQKGISTKDKINVSQIVKEYNNRIIDYFYSSKDFDINTIDLNLLISLANRSFENNYHRKLYNSRCFELNEVAANRSLKLGKYKDAKHMYSNLFKLASRFLDQESVAKIEENLNELKIRNLLHVVECSLLLNDVNAARNELNRLEDTIIKKDELIFEKELLSSKVNLEEGNDDQAFDIANKLINYDNLNQSQTDELLLILAQIHDNKDEDDKALNIYTKMNSTLKEENLKKANILSKICDIYVQHDKVEEAKKIGINGLKISERLNNKFSISDFLYELTLIAMRENDKDSIKVIKDKSSVLKNNNFSCSKNELTFFLCDLSLFFDNQIDYETIMKNVRRLTKIFSYKKDAHRENQVLLLELLINITQKGSSQDIIKELKELLSDKKIHADFRIHVLFAMLYTDLTILEGIEDYSEFNQLNTEKISLIPTLIPKYNILKEFSKEKPFDQIKSKFLESLKNEKHILLLEEFPFCVKKLELTKEDVSLISKKYFANEKIKNFINI